MKGLTKASTDKTRRPFFKASLNGTDLEMMVYSEIGETWDGKGISALDVKAQIDAAGSISGITLRINSPGGDVFEGVAIYNLLRAQKVPISVCIDGVAASSASIIAMAGTTRTIGPNALIMIHNAWTVAMGNADELRKMADTLDKVSGSIAQTYITTTGQTAAAIKEMMDSETWLNAQDCLDKGFATSIAEKDDESAQALAKTFKGLKRYKATPATLKANSDDACDCTCDACQEGDCANCTNADCTDDNCADCPMQVDDFEDSNLSQYEARLSLLKLSNAIMDDAKTSTELGGALQKSRK